MTEDIIKKVYRTAANGEVLYDKQVILPTNRSGWYSMIVQLINECDLEYQQTHEKTTTTKIDSATGETNISRLRHALREKAKYTGDSGDLGLEGFIANEIPDLQLSDFELAVIAAVTRELRYYGRLKTR